MLAFAHEPGFSIVGEAVQAFDRLPARALTYSSFTVSPAARDDDARHPTPEMNACAHSSPLVYVAEAITIFS